VKKIISSASLLFISAALFAQTTGTTPQETKSKVSKSSPNQIAVSDPGVPNKAARTAAPAPSPAANDANKPKGKAKGHSKHHKK